MKPTHEQIADKFTEIGFEVDKTSEKLDDTFDLLNITHELEERQLMLSKIHELNKELHDQGIMLKTLSWVLYGIEMSN